MNGKPIELNECKGANGPMALPLPELGIHIEGSLQDIEQFFKKNPHLPPTIATKKLIDISIDDIRKINDQSLTDYITAIFGHLDLNKFLTFHTDNPFCFRARPNEKYTPFSNIGELSYPPIDKLQNLNRYGRFNTPNQQTYYCSQNGLVSVSEVVIKIGSSYTVLKSRLTKSPALVYLSDKILGLPEPFQDRRQEIVDWMYKYTSLPSPDSETHENYRLGVAIGNAFMQSEEVDGIAYLCSKKPYKNGRPQINYALKKAFADSYLKPDSAANIRLIRIGESKYTFITECTAKILPNGIIDWDNQIQMKTCHIF